MNLREKPVVKTHEDARNEAIRLRRRDERILQQYRTIGKAVGLTLLVMAAAGGFLVMRARIRSDTFNRVTGAQTTWWDALWLDLRVINEPKTH